MTEKLFTGTLNKNQNKTKQNKIHTEIINSIHSWFGDFKIGGVI